VFNSLTWGPDGWLYGCNGIIADSKVGVPGTPEDKRVHLNCGVWRYHPIRKTFEAFAHGTTNPWGLDFDDYGEMFITNCVIKHIFHVVPGAHFVRMYGQDINPHSYQLMESCADHIHWGGGSWTDSRGGKGTHDAPGGGHAHAGAMVYLGDNWPDEYRNRVFMCNIHGNRINQDILERKGSGYVAKHGQDFLMANDPWFRGLIVQAAHDGGVYIADWCDTGECHNYKEVNPRGRIYKITYGEPKQVKVDLAKLSDKKLAELQMHKNDWYVRRARVLLQERAAAKKLDKEVEDTLVDYCSPKEDSTATRHLRALWALEAIGRLHKGILMVMMESRAFAMNNDTSLRVWAVRLAAQRASDNDILESLEKAAKQEKSPSVRIAIASALPRLPAEQRWRIAEALVASEKDSNPDQALMLWYGVEGLVATDSQRAAKHFAVASTPLLREFTARRIASSNNLSSLQPLLSTLTSTKDDSVQSDILRGIRKALAGQRLPKAPEGWSDARKKLMASKNTEVGQHTMVLSGIFADPEALAMLRQYAGDAKEDLSMRQTALQTLIEVKADGVPALLRELLADTKMRAPAIRGLAAVNDAEAPQLILTLYPKLADEEKRDAIATLASRPAFAFALLDAVEKKTVPSRDVSVFAARQIVNLKDKKLTERLNSVWGTIGSAPAAEKTKLLSKYKALVPADKLAKADRSAGRAIFAKTCATCHKLFDEGAKIGPDLTGSQRANPEYLLSKLVDPSFAVPRDFQMVVVETKSGRFISGIITADNGQTITVQTQNEAINVAKNDVESRTPTKQSLMPEGMLDHLKEEEIRALIAYLSGPTQVPLPK
jgi:putative heme-binding domain-containing protein